MFKTEINLPLLSKGVGIVTIFLIGLNVWMAMSTSPSASTKNGHIKLNDFYETSEIKIDPETGFIDIYPYDMSTTIVLSNDISLNADGTTENSEPPFLDAYVLEGSDSRYITVSETLDLSDELLRIARNEIYARHGRMFNDTFLQVYFDQKSWYTKTYSAEDFDALGNSLFNKFEIANLELLSSL